MLFFPVPFLAIGGAGLFYVVWSWGKSAERRAMLAQVPARLDLFDHTGGVEPQCPYVPSDADLTDSPGTRLMFRLPVASRGWSLAILGGITLVWNLIVAWWTWEAVELHLQGNPDWLLTIFLLPFLLIGSALVLVLVRRILVDTVVGPTIVEISGHPLYPGQSYELFISQAARSKLERFEMLLVCEEEATYRQGTDTRTATRRVCEQRVFRRDAIAMGRDEPFEAKTAFTVPPGAMHSFRSDHNRVHWRLIAKGKTSRRPEFERSFKLCVYPHPGGNAA